MFEPLFHTWCRERFSRLARLRKAFARFALTVFGLALSVPTFAVGTTNTNIAINTASSILDTQTAFITVNVNNPTTFGTTPTGTISLNQSFNGTPTFGIGCSPLQPGAQVGKALTTCTLGPGSAAGTYTFAAVYDGDSTFAAKTSTPVNQAVIKTWALTIVGGANGTLVLNGAPFTSGNTIRVAQSVVQNIVATPASNFHVSLIPSTCGGSSAPGGPANVAVTVNSSYGSDCTATFAFSNQRNTSVRQTGSGSVIGGPPSVTEGGSITVVASPASDSEVDFITDTPSRGVATTQNFLAGAPLGIPFLTGAKSMVVGPYISNHTVAVTFTAVTRVAVSGVATAGGTISPAQRQVPRNTDSFVQFTATANPGFQLTNFNGCPIGTLVGNVYSTGAISEACTVTATFALLPPIAVTAVAGSGGSITPASRAVPPGQGTSFTVTPNSGFLIGTVTGCSGTLSGTTYDTGVINAPCDVTATFVPMPTFLVSTSAGSGGSIAPTSALLTAGGSQQFTVTANAGFGVTSVTGCSAVFLGITYRVDAASAPCTFSATFAPLPSQTTERTILIALYNSTNGANWSNKTNWLGAVGTECTWFGVLCDATGARVVRIDLNSNNLRGSLPPIAGLTALQHFNVSLNQLTGSVPALTGMTSLESFKLTNNRFTGVLPDLSGLTALQQFYVIGNRLTGAIPNIPNPSALIAGGSSLCVNFFTPSVNSAWNAATGESPWFARCTAVPFVVTVSKTGNGQIMADSPQDKLPGSTIVVLAVPDVGHEVSMGGTCGGALVGAVFTSNPITADCTVIANFVPEPTSFTITPRVFGLGTVAPSTPQIVARGASVTFTVTLEPGRTYTAGGTCGFSGGTTTSPARENCFVDFTFTSLATLLDIDASGGLTKYDPATDGVMILRYLLGMTGDAITNGAMSATAVRSPELARIELNNIRALLDIDGNRRVEPLTDGLMIVRYMMGLRMPRVTAGVLGTGATRTPAEIDAYLAGLMP